MKQYLAKANSYNKRSKQHKYISSRALESEAAAADFISGAGHRPGTPRNGPSYNKHSKQHKYVSIESEAAAADLYRRGHRPGASRNGPSYNKHSKQHKYNPRLQLQIYIGGVIALGHLETVRPTITFQTTQIYNPRLQLQIYIGGVIALGHLETVRPTITLQTTQIYLQPGSRIRLLHSVLCCSGRATLKLPCSY